MHQAELDMFQAGGGGEREVKHEDSRMGFSLWRSYEPKGGRQRFERGNPQSVFLFAFLLNRPSQRQRLASKKSCFRPSGKWRRI